MIGARLWFRRTRKVPRIGAYSLSVQVAVVGNGDLTQLDSGAIVLYLAEPTAPPRYKYGSPWPRRTNSDPATFGHEC